MANLRHVPMDSTVTTLLRDIPRRGTSELVFPNKLGERFLEVRWGFKGACERAGITNLRFHDLRHTFASHWMMNGGDLYVLKEILGHKSVQMTARYAHLSHEFKRAAVNRMDNIWQKDQPSPHASNSPVQTPPVTLQSQEANFSAPTVGDAANDAGLDVAG